MAAKKSTKGKRYSDEEKKRIVQFVNQVNTEKGRGGASAAGKKFGVSAVTLSTWLSTTPSEGTLIKGGGSRNKILERLGRMDREIETKRKELSKLEAAFDKLKAQL